MDALRGCRAVTFDFCNNLLSVHTIMVIILRFAILNIKPKILGPFKKALCTQRCCIQHKSGEVITFYKCEVSQVTSGLRSIMTVKTLVCARFLCNSVCRRLIVTLD